MPQLGETVAEGKISKWFVSAGDAVKPGDNLFEIETDKVSMEVPAISAGTLAAIHVQAGEVAPVGAVVAIIQGKGETVSLARPTPPVRRRKRGSSSRNRTGFPLARDERCRAAPLKPATQMEPFREVRSPERNYGPARLPGGTVVTPLARRLAGEAGIDLTNLKGSGPHGRIVARRHRAGAKAPALAPAPVDGEHRSHRGRRRSVSRSPCARSAGESSSRDVIVKAWATALRRAMPDAEQSDIALADRQSAAV